jgi:hypothetical protein
LNGSAANSSGKRGHTLGTAPRALHHRSDARLHWEIVTGDDVLDKQLDQLRRDRRYASGLVAQV